MVPIEMRLKAERRLRQLLAEGGYAQPDVIQYGRAFIHLFWHRARVSILVEITRKGEVGKSHAFGPVPETNAYTPVSLEGLVSQFVVT
jgi:hypothetical protein